MTRRLAMKVIVDFNPRTREGCDLGAMMQAAQLGVISIHAPVKGATVATDYMGSRTMLFQSTHP